ncbi:hypothetical protein LJY25_01730 [Hymenobacter sp. BT175]|uniref:hypothetical protein n=1 Tax=Hymenobacter translucens TaxID=2886507 RepID=UPI001D0E0F32|nr:hypothetical protein [Hymenobacter translucens]MCC2545152.1 hypothetical protein [Hymenobacter translucens]
MRLLLLFLFLAIVSPAVSQSPARVAVPGTKISMVPPTDFELTTNFSGFEQLATGASIMVNELPGSAPVMIKNLTESALAARGMKLLHKEPVNTPGVKGMLYKIKQHANGIMYRKSILVFGDEARTLMATATYPEAHSELEAPLQASLLTCRYAPQQSNDKPVARLTVDVAGTKFKFAKNLAGGLIYTTDGKLPSLAADRAVFIVGSSLNYEQIADEKAYSLERLRKLPHGQTNQVRTITPITIDGLEGYEIVADGLGSQKQKQVVYQTILYPETGGYYWLVGTTENRSESDLNLFKTLAQSFRRL